MFSNMSPPDKLYCIMVLVGLFGATSANLSTGEKERLCRQRTGLASADIGQKNARNENCAVDCITNQGTVMTAYVEDGTNCHQSDGYKCVLGKCRSSDDSLEEESKLDLITPDISIKSAFVADRDPYPTQGESDAFVVAELVSGGKPAYKNGDLICHTHVIQDNSRPRWNFNCRSLPIRGAALLRFSVYDSDKPDTNPQLLGYTVRSLDELINGGSQQLTLETDDLPGGPYFLEVEVQGKKYSANELYY